MERESVTVTQLLASQGQNLAQIQQAQLPAQPCRHRKHPDRPVVDQRQEWFKHRPEIIK